MHGRLFILLCALTIPIMTGCAVPLGLAVTGLSAAQAGSSAWVNGELREAVLVDLESVHHAAGLAMHDLDVVVRTDRLGKRSAYIMAGESGGPEIKVSMSRRTPNLTRIGVRIGILGELSTSRAVLERILANLPPPAAPGVSPSVE